MFAFSLILLVVINISLKPEKRIAKTQNLYYERPFDMKRTWIFELQCSILCKCDTFETIKDMSPAGTTEPAAQVQVFEAAGKSMEFYRVWLKVHDFCISCTGLLHAYK